MPPVIYCPECDAENEAKSLVCLACGHAFKGDPTALLFSHATAPTHAPPPPVASPATDHPVGSGLLPADSVLQNRYRITQLLGQGGMGAVYLASDARFSSRTCVIKEMLDHFNDPEQRAQATESFHREADLLATFKHPGIPEVYDRFTEANRHYLVMEYINGVDLEQRLLDNGLPFTEKEVIDWSIQCCDVLSYLHHQNPPIIYRDMKPANIITTHWGKAYLVDFGIARFFNPVTRGTMIGTQGYAPPEQYRGQVDPRSDIYALGATMHYLLTGRDPQNEAPFSFPPVSTLNASVSPEMEMLILKALDPEPDNRFASADEMLGQLMAIGGDETNFVRDCPHCGHRSSVTRQFCPNCKQYISKKAHVLKPQDGTGTIMTDAAGYHQVKAAGRTAGLVAGNRSATATVLAVPTGRVDFSLRRVSPLALGAVLTAGLALSGWLSWQWWNSRPEPITSEGQTCFMPGDRPAKAEGQAAFARGQFVQAVDAYRRAIEQTPADGEARIYLQNAHVRLAKADSVKVAIAGAFSGQRSPLAQDMLRGAALAQQQANARGRLPKIQLTLLDDAGSTLRALEGADLVSHDPSLVGVLGHLGTQTTQAALKRYADGGVPVITLVPGSWDALDAPKALVRFAGGEADWAAAWIDQAKRVWRADKVILLESGDERSGRSAMGTHVSRWAVEKGLGYETVSWEAQNSASILSQLKPQAKTVLLWAGNLEDAVRIKSDLASAGSKAPLLAGPLAYQPERLAGLGAAAEGLTCLVPYAVDHRMAGSSDYEMEFRNRFQTEPGWMASLTYDALAYLVQALDRVGPHRDALGNALLSLGQNGHRGLIGPLHLNRDGEARRPMELFEVRSGRYTSLRLTGM
ncbi:MAG: ABC transporter substrate-binding protein [Candidatus Sericytochromatia bacterium]|nr:ABC transporter substrate-binding protein [Candidatus Sericytochromatia bacterium]